MEVAATATAALGLRAAHVREHIFLVNFFVVSDDVATKTKLFGVPQHNNPQGSQSSKNSTQQKTKLNSPGKIKIF